LNFGIFFVSVISKVETQTTKGRWMKVSEEEKDSIVQPMECEEKKINGFM